MNDSKGTTIDDDDSPAGDQHVDTDSLAYFTDGIRDSSVRSCCFANTLVGANNATYRRCTTS